MCNCNVPNCKWQLSDYYGITTKQIHPLTNLMFMWFLIHPLTNPMLHDFSFILMCFATRCLVMGSNVIIQQLISTVLAQGGHLV
jgi:hypothetical protein